VGFCFTPNQAPAGATEIYQTFSFAAPQLVTLKLHSHGSRRGLLSFRRSTAKNVHPPLLRPERRSAPFRKIAAAKSGITILLAGIGHQNIHRSAAFRPLQPPNGQTGTNLPFGLLNGEAA
jgi:hypothetical protein